ncbi:MAG: PaREP1 family protein [Pyrobaculum sp.]
MEFPVLAKPWRDPGRYREARMREAEIECRLALEFLSGGLVRNAAGKAFQCWKAYLAALAVEGRDMLKARFPGVVRLRRGEAVEEVEDVDVVIAVMPTTRMAEVAALLSRRFGEEVLKNTFLALELHRYQYNGPDPEAVISNVPDDSTAARLICILTRDLAMRSGDLNKIYVDVCK